MGSGVGIPYGTLLAVHGINNIYEGISGKSGYLREGYRALSTVFTGKANYGNSFYNHLDVGLSIYGASRLVVNPNSWKLFKNIPSDYMRGYQAISRYLFGLDAVSGVNTLFSEYQEGR